MVVENHSNTSSCELLEATLLYFTSYKLRIESKRRKIRNQPAVEFLLWGSTRWSCQPKAQLSNIPTKVEMRLFRAKEEQNTYGNADGVEASCCYLIDIGLVEPSLPVRRSQWRKSRKVTKA
jgi:hypothetical protein